jgi:hypothetical protein
MQYMYILATPYIGVNCKRPAGIFRERRAKIIVIIIIIIKKINKKNTIWPFSYVYRYCSSPHARVRVTEQTGGEGESIRVFYKITYMWCDVCECVCVYVPAESAGEKKEIKEFCFIRTNSVHHIYIMCVVCLSFLDLWCLCWMVGVTSAPNTIYVICCMYRSIHIQWLCYNKKKFETRSSLVANVHTRSS